MRNFLLCCFFLPSVAGAAQDLTFAKAYDTILQRSLRVQAQKLAVEASQETRRLRYGDFLPTTSAQVSESHGASASPRAGVLLGRVNLFRAGADVSALQASYRDVDASRERLKSERQKVEEEAGRALLDFIARIRQREIVAKIVQLKIESHKVARENYSRGVLPMEDVDKVAIEVENSKARLIDAETREAESRATLLSALGSGGVAAEWPWKDSIAKGSSLETKELELRARPDWRAAEATFGAESLRKDQAFRSFLPSLDLEASYGAPLDDLDQRDWRTTLALTVPLFEGFKKLSRYNIQSLEVRTAQLAMEVIRRAAPAEAESLRKNHKAARESALAREKTAQMTDRLYSANLKRFRLGRTSANDLALDQDRLLESQLLEVEGWSSAHLTFIRLCHGLGGFVTGDGQCRDDAVDL